MSAKFAGILGLTAFVAMLVRGLAHARGADATLLSGSLTLFLFAAIGWIIGAVAQWCVDDAVYTRIEAEAAAEAALAAKSGAGQ